jgi:hypothetical protein
MKFALILILIIGKALQAAPVPVRHIQGYFHGFIVLKDLNNKMLARGEVKQFPVGNRLNNILTLRFDDGSINQETAVYSQQHVFRLISYKQVQKGPAFKNAQTLTLDMATGNVNVSVVDSQGKTKEVSQKMALPDDLANGLLPTVLADINPKEETILSMVAATPEPRIVKLTISHAGENSFLIAGTAAPAMHYVMKIEIGGVIGVAAKVLGKLPPPVDFWFAAGDAPTFLRSDAPLYNGGPIWRIELASPTWPAAAAVH